MRGVRPPIRASGWDLSWGNCWIVGGLGLRSTRMYERSPTRWRLVQLGFLLVKIFFTLTPENVDMPSLHSGIIATPPPAVSNLLNTFAQVSLPQVSFFQLFGRPSAAWHRVWTTLPNGSELARNFGVPAFSASRYQACGLNIASGKAVHNSGWHRRHRKVVFPAVPPFDCHCWSSSWDVAENSSRLEKNLCVFLDQVF